MDYKEVPGNSTQSHANYQRVLVRFAEHMLDFERVAEREYERGVSIDSVTIRLPQEDRTEYLAVLRAHKEGVGFVSFHNAPTLWECLEGLVNRLQNGSLRWKEDEYGR